MSNDNHLKNIVIVGASGNVGRSTLHHLLASPHTPTLTILTHSTSTSTFPTHPSLTVKKGSYTDPAFLASVFTNQDAVLLALGFRAMDQQTHLIAAAAKAGVEWILPTEYAGDGMDEGMTARVPIFQPKLAARRQIEELARTAEGRGVKWIGIATNPWTEFSLRMGLFGVDFEGRKATVYRDGGEFNTSSLEQVGLGIARLLGLPVESEGDERACLEYYGNNFVYISSFLTTQQGLLEAVQRATKTGEGDWTVDRRSTIQDWITRATEKMQKGDFLAGASLTFANYMGEGLGGNYQDKAMADLKVLGMQEEDLDAVVAKAVAAGKMQSPF